MATIPVPQLPPTSLIPPTLLNPISSLTVSPLPPPVIPRSKPDLPPPPCPHPLPAVDLPPPPPENPRSTTDLPPPPSFHPISGAIPPPPLDPNRAFAVIAPVAAQPSSAPILSNPRSDRVSSRSVPSSSSAPPPPPPPPHTNLPLSIPPSTPLPRHQRPVSSTDPKESAPPPQQLSYAQAARSSRGPSFVRAHASDVEFFAKIPRTGVNIICGSKEGIPSFSFVTADLPKVEELYSNALVMKFIGGRPSLESSHKEILSWGIEHPFSIGPLTSRAFLLRFQDNRDLLKVLTRPSTMLITFPYKVFRWHNLCHLTEDSCLAPVWISLPRLPLQSFIPEFLDSVANKIGCFLCFDKATTTLARPSAARICVELDLRKPPLNSSGLVYLMVSNSQLFMKECLNIVMVATDLGIHLMSVLNLVMRIPPLILNNEFPICNPAHHLFDVLPLGRHRLTTMAFTQPRWPRIKNLPPHQPTLLQLLFQQLKIATNPQSTTFPATILRSRHTST